VPAILSIVVYAESGELQTRDTEDTMNYEEGGQDGGSDGEGEVGGG
jgi:hypothetical protein